MEHIYNYKTSTGDILVRACDQSIIDQQGNLMQILFVAGLNCFIHKQVHSYKYYECSQAEC